MRLLVLLLGLAGVVLVPFFLWGGDFMARLGGAAAGEWLAEYGTAWGWLAALLLLVGDLILPVPATSVISALGYVYGALMGGLVGGTGSFLSGGLAYELCRRCGRRAADRLLGPADRERAGRIFAGGTAGWLVALSRWMPLLPEMTACMAGLTGMPRRRFFSALACGCGPMGLTFAAIGATGLHQPGLALALSALVPGLLYVVVARWLKRQSAV